MKIVVNKCYGGFGLSDKGERRLSELKGTPTDSFEVGRADPMLVQVVEELGEEANGGCSSLKVVEIPEDVKWHIVEYDGHEHIAEDHRTW